MKTVRYIFYFMTGALVGLHGSLSDWSSLDIVVTAVGIGILFGILEAVLAVESKS